MNGTRRSDLRVVQSATRCPFCHEEIAVLGRDWVACRECLARHHEACWREGGSCATCASREVLVAAAPVAATPERTSMAELEAEILRHDRDWAAERVRVHGLRFGDEPDHAMVNIFMTTLIAGVCLLHLCVLMRKVDAAALSLVLVVMGVIGVPVARGRRERFLAARARSRARRGELVAALAAAGGDLGGPSPDATGRSS